MTIVLNIRRIIACVTLACAFQSSAAEKPILPPPYQGVYQPQGVDELGLWREDDEQERELTASPLVIHDEHLTDYVKHVLCETVGEDRCSAVRVYIIREPTFNASMSPNGTLRVFTGLFLRVENEAELGAVLGHEFGHFESRHSLNIFRAQRKGSDILAWSGLLVSMAPTYAGMHSYQNLQLAIYGSIFRHSRDQERQADRLGIAYLNQSHLRPQAAAQVWCTVMAEAEASANAKGLKKPNFKMIAFTASHPPDEERAEYLSELAAPDGSSRDDGEARYRAALAPWLPQFLSDQIKLNDFGGSDFLIQNLARGGWTAQLWFARAELYRTRGNPRDLVHSTRFYESALELNSNLAEAHRGLGLALMKTGHRTEGQAELSRYLALAPDASDAAMIKLMVPGEKTQ